MNEQTYEYAAQAGGILFKKVYVNKPSRKSDKSLMDEVDCNGCNACCMTGPSPSTIMPALDGWDMLRWHLKQDACYSASDEPCCQIDQVAMDPDTHILRCCDDSACLWQAENGIGCSLHGSDYKPPA